MFGMSVSDLHSFVRSEFGGSDLGDARLDRRLVILVAKLAADRAERIADLVLRTGSHAITPPSDRNGRGRPRKVNLLWIVEEKPPSGVAALE